MSNLLAVLSLKLMRICCSCCIMKDTTLLSVSYFHFSSLIPECCWALPVILLHEIKSTCDQKCDQCTPRVNMQGLDPVLSCCGGSPNHGITVPLPSPKHDLRIRSTIEFSNI